jgi:modification target Cys-rich repeat protein
MSKKRDKNEEENEEIQLKKNFLKKMAELALPAIALISMTSSMTHFASKTINKKTKDAISLNSLKGTASHSKNIQNCTNACFGTCSGNCHGDCTGTCSYGCQNSCDLTCQGGCQGGCQGSCDLTCQGTCNYTCSGSCSHGCGNGNS